jgi:single-stranded-DNA-specific exonuclease
MIDFIRSAQEFLVDAGGHPMAAGFTVETKKLPLLQKALEDKANLLINEDLLTRNLKIDMNLSLSEIKPFLFESLQRLSPFGMGNPEPTFVSSGIVEDMRLVGADGKHLKLKIYDPKSGVKFGAIGFGFGENKENLNTGNKINIVYTIAKDSWSGDKQLQLKLKDFRKSVD